MENQETNTIQQFIFIQSECIFDNSNDKRYTVNGDHHNIISQSRQVKNNHQNNIETQTLQTEIKYLKNEVDFLKKQLEVTQGLLEKSLSRE